LPDRLSARESDGSRILLLATTRPEYRPGWASRVQSLSLGPPAPRESLALLADWLGAAGTPPPRRAVAARAGGNPLFVQEMIRSLVERGMLHGKRGAYELATPIDEITLPETVQTVLAS